jgi:hypothetical protein
MTTAPAPGVTVTIAPSSPAFQQQSVLSGANQVAYYIWDGQGWCVSSNTGGGAGSTAVLLGRSLFVSETTGNDSTAAPNHVELPYATIAAAVADATVGDDVFVYPGNYAGFTAKSGVNVVGVDVEHYNGNGFTEAFPVHGIQISGTITVPFNVAPFPLIGLSNLQVTAPPNAAALAFGGGGNIQAVTMDDVVLGENAAGNSSVAVVQLDIGTILLNNCSIQATDGSTTLAVDIAAGSSGNSTINANYSAIRGNWRCADDQYDAEFQSCAFYTGNYAGVPAEFYLRTKAYNCTFKSINGALSLGLLLRNRCLFSNCVFEAPVSIPANAATSTSKGLEADYCKFNAGLANLMVLSNPNDAVVRLKNCIVNNVLDFSTPSAVSLRLFNCTVELFFSGITLAPEAAGNGAYYSFESCTIKVFGGQHIVLRQAAVLGNVSLTMKNCAVTCSTGTACVQFEGPADIAHAPNYVFANNSFEGANFGVGADNATHITSGGNTVGTAPGYDANITVSLALTVF